MNELAKIIDMLPTKTYAVMYVVDDNICLASAEFVKESNYTYHFRLGSGWLNLPKDIILGITDNQTYINMSKNRILKEGRDRLPLLNNKENKTKGRVIDKYTGGTIG